MKEEKKQQADMKKENKKKLGAACTRKYIRLRIKNFKLLSKIQRRRRRRRRRRRKEQRKIRRRDEDKN